MSRPESQALTYKRNELKLLTEELTTDLLSPSSTYGLNPGTQEMIREFINARQPRVETIDAYRQATDGLVADIKQAVPMYFKTHHIGFFDQSRIIATPTIVDAVATGETKDYTPGRST